MGLLDIIREEATRHRFSRLERIVVEIGALSHVDPHALSTAFAAAVQATLYAGAALDIVAREGTAWCLDCESAVAIAKRDASCPRCGGNTLLVRGGEEMKLKFLEVV